MLEVIRPGILTTVQDLGRSGYRHLGVAQCGALDQDALICGNRLLGNEPTAAGLEIVLGPIEIRFTQASWFALSGADFNAQLDGEPASCGWTHYARAGQVLRLSGAKLGMRAYLTVAGGIATEPVMGSRATDLKAGLGGLAGRALQAGDRLALGQPRQLGRKRGMGLRHWHP
ncbi:biotin-dependent carboxyltransferase family protein, partial [Aeromonas cavernicola]